ncbi:hypothetical protein GKC56_03000 [Neisseriaceae bacterium PsAf]|nr:hypothetical protein [Neisseriaceae bacterium PsAf]MCV2503395.1 hypothetical protein [Neisseriaceae bacterium]
MSNDQRKYSQMEADILRTKLELAYVKQDVELEQKPKSLSDQLMSYIPALGNVGKMVLTNRTVISRLTPLVVSLLLSKKAKSAAKFNKKTASKTSKKIKKK